MLQMYSKRPFERCLYKETLQQFKDKLKLKKIEAETNWERWLCSETSCMWQEWCNRKSPQSIHHNGPDLSTDVFCYENFNDIDNETPSRQVRRVKGSLLGPKAMIVGQNLLSENCHDQAQ